jgi:regulatory protein
MEEESQKARDVALSFLSARARSVHEVREKLQRQRFAAGVIERVIADFRRLKLLDDREFARSWVESRAGRRPAGTAKFVQDLRRKGIDREIIDEVLAEFAEELDSDETAASLLRRQRWRFAGVEEVKAKRRMLGLLARRGYAQETAQKAVETVWEEFRKHDLEGD